LAYPFYEELGQKLNERRSIKLPSGRVFW